MSLVLGQRSLTVAVLKEVPLRNRDRKGALSCGVPTIERIPGKLEDSENFSEAPWILSEKHVVQNILPYTARI